MRKIRVLRKNKGISFQFALDLITPDIGAVGEYQAHQTVFEARSSVVDLTRAFENRLCKSFVLLVCRANIERITIICVIVLGTFASVTLRSLEVCERTGTSFEL